MSYKAVLIQQCNYKAALLETIEKSSKVEDSATKWARILASGVKEFVPVMRYSVQALLSLRQNANPDVHVDAPFCDSNNISRASSCASVPNCGVQETAARKISLKDSDSMRSSSPTLAHHSDDDCDMVCEKDEGWTTVEKKVRTIKKAPKANAVVEGGACKASSATNSRPVLLLDPLYNTSILQTCPVVVCLACQKCAASASSANKMRRPAPYSSPGSAFA
eukprot:CAMPEP_0202815114 /NCGR_PEP_ID=MMETSP1389-20130828/6028_1 /ASSEMBLY_ACC=CAM_ASM_000865 /TAXON_ID=302021 /ORGANISM="Rhodomonas sp., Strain CCMP768" /LENGTH=220 /DNA_ID=CAMNT_0049486989 /DNA_START=52 /DNA_END=711 /DNA_ORIENTATION=+